MNRTRIAGILAALGAAALLYLAAWPVPIEPNPWSATPDPGLTGPYAGNDRLREAQRLFANDVRGPDFILVDRRGRLVTGQRDGRIVHLKPESDSVEVLTVAGGRPMGLVHTPVETFVVADPVHGLVGAKGYRRFGLVSEADGAPVRYASDVALTARNEIYFLDASSRFGFGDSYAAMIEHGADGRLLRYDDLKDEATAVLRGLHFPGGLALGPDDAYLLISETPEYRVLRHWLSGERAGQTDVFIDALPGFPAHITWNGSDTFWLALYAPRVALLDRLSGWPWLRKVFYRLPAALRPPPERRAWVLGLDPDGTVIHNLQYAGDGAYAPVTSVREHDGWLYLGSLTQDGVARIRVPH